MNIIVTCGPSYEPIDRVRRLTNFSTGRLGITLANTFAKAGHSVYCFKGEQATDQTPLEVRPIPFSTNDDLAEKLRALRNKSVDAVFHAAALCDFKVATVQNTKGEKLAAAKFPTRGDNLNLTLEPTTKVLPQLRGLFPKARIVGWKYELDGTRDEAVAKALRQMNDAQTDACVLNGDAYGAGFGFCLPGKGPLHIENLADLCAFLLSWTGNSNPGTFPPPLVGKI